MTGVLNIDKRDIAKDIESILQHSQEYPFALNCEQLTNEWFENKAEIIRRFGGNLIIKSKDIIKIKLSQKQRSRRFRDFLSMLDDSNVLTSEFEAFLYENEKGFYDNRVVQECSAYGVPAGMKLSKSFKKFLPDQKTIREVQNVASQFIQEDKVEGYLYLSVDPKDFLSMSENNAGWWSCQALDGDYRSGALSYMVDPTTIVAYLASSEEEFLRAFPIQWNSKKWRMLVHTDFEKSIIYSRQYPYDSDDLLSLVHNMICGLTSVSFEEPYQYGFSQNGDMKITFNQINFGGRTFDMRDIIQTKNNLGYCDLLTSNSYVPIVAISEKLMDKYFNEYLAPEITPSLDSELNFVQHLFDYPIGNYKPSCPCCGENFVYRGDSFLCLDCIAEYDADEDFYISCCCCGHRIYEDEEVIKKDGHIFCKHCWNTTTREE